MSEHKWGKRQKDEGTKSNGENIEEAKIIENEEDLLIETHLQAKFKCEKKGFVNHKQSQKKIKYLSQDDESNNNSNKMFLKLKKKLSMSAYIVPKYLNLNKHLGEHMKV